MASEQGVPAKQGVGGGDALLGSDRLLRGLVIAVLLCLILVGALLALRDLLAAIIILSTVGLAVAGLTIVTSRWQSQRASLIQALAIAVERGMPLAAAVEALGYSQRGRPRQRLLVLTRLLQEGAPLPQALELVPGVLPREAETSIGMGWATDRLAGTLREAADLSSEVRGNQATVVPRLAYLLVVLLITQLILSFILYFIFPKFEAIFFDFGIGLPSFTRGTIIATHFMITRGWPILALLTICELAVAIILPLSITNWWDPRLFGIDRLFRSRHTAPVLRALAWGVEGGKSFSSAIAILIRYSPAGWVQNRLTLTLHDLNNGVDAWLALRNRGLIGSADAAILESASRVGNLPWALREAASGAARRSALRLQRWILIATLLIYLALGLLVLVAAAAVVTPLFRIIEMLAG